MTNAFAPTPGLRDARLMQLFLTPWAMRELEQAQLEAVAARSHELIDLMLTEIEGRAPTMVAVANEEGARHMAAASFLLRACELLRECRAAEGNPMLQALGVRSIFELTIVGRFLLEHSDGPDEFRRRFASAIGEEAKFARAVGIEPGGVPDFLQRVVDSEQKPPRQLKSMAEAIDRLDGRDKSMRYSATHTYGLVYGYVSSVGSHANVLSIKRHSRREGALLSIEPNPQPIFERPAILLIACFVRELAASVFTALQLPADGIPDEIQRPPQEEDAKAEDEPVESSI